MHAPRSLANSSPKSLSVEGVLLDRRFDISPAVHVRETPKIAVIVKYASINFLVLQTFEAGEAAHSTASLLQTLA